MSALELIITHGVSVLAGGGLTAVVVALINARNARHQTDRTMEAQLEEHRDGLALDLLRTAREERAAMRIEIDRLRALASHLDDFDLALAHIEALLSADQVGNRRAVERSARKFLSRIQEQREVAAGFRAEAQSAVSGVRVDGGQK